MLIYKCTKCGTKLILSYQLNHCEVCGSKELNILHYSCVQELPQNLKARTKEETTGSKEQSTQSEPHFTSVQGVLIPSEDNLNQVNPPYFSVSPVKTYRQPIYGRRKNFFSIFWKRSTPLLLLLILFLTGLVYKIWQERLFNTQDFQKVVLQENFKRPRGWSLSRGASFKDGGLFHLQPDQSYYSASLWLGKNFSEVDFSSDVNKVAGLDNLPFGIIAQANGKYYQYFYYLLIDGQGRFTLGKSNRSNWLSLALWKKSSLINRHNARNRLRIVYKDNLIIALINNQVVATFSDKDYQSGKIGVFSLRGSGGAVAVYFDNVLAKER